VTPPWCICPPLSKVAPQASLVWSETCSKGLEHCPDQNPPHTRIHTLHLRPLPLTLITSTRERIFMNMYVDDLFLAANPSKAKDDIISGLPNTFAITNLGIMSNPLGIEVTRNHTTGSVLLSQSKLCQSLLEEMGMQNASPRTIPLDINIKLTKTPLDEVHTVVPESVYPHMKVVGTLLHLVNYTRPDLPHAVGILCRFNHAPGPPHIATAKSVLRYLNGTRHLGVSYSSTSTPLQGNCDPDYAGGVDGRKSTTGWIWTKNGGPISWGGIRHQGGSLAQEVPQGLWASCPCPAHLH
jgi:hypothetical protein